MNKAEKKKMKEMEMQKRLEEAQTAPQAMADEPQEMSFDQWWMGLIKDRPMRPHLKEVMWADFKARGLSKNESKERFDEALRLCGM